MTLAAQEDRDMSNKTAAGLAAYAMAQIGKHGG